MSADPNEECANCGAPSTSIYSTPLDMAWCCRTCRNGGSCDCAEREP